MKRLHVTVFVAILVCAMVAKAQLPTFVHPPQTSIYSTWTGQHPYQREIYWDFSINPSGNANPNGIPGATYGGSLDSLVWNSDYVAFSGGMQYFSAAQSPDGIAGVGINNTGSETITGTANFYLGTTTGAAGNNIWVESQFQTAYHPTSFGEGVSTPGQPPSGSLVYYDSWQVVPGAPSLGVGILHDLGLTLTPNPPWEAFTVDFQASPGSYLILNSLHIAAESVPEPTTFSLLALGSLAHLRRRRGKV